MNREDELFARVIAQQQQITALHTALARVKKHLGPSIGDTRLADIDTRLADIDAMLADIDAALEMSEPASRAEFELAVALATKARTLSLRAELTAVHEKELAARDAHIAELTRAQGKRS
ncbi:MAG: hypothetical protein ABI790_05400 [Betaproteobacteria bacterium]